MAASRYEQLAERDYGLDHDDYQPRVSDFASHADRRSTGQSAENVGDVSPVEDDTTDQFSRQQNQHASVSSIDTLVERGRKDTFGTVGATITTPSTLQRSVSQQSTDTFRSLGRRSLYSLIELKERVGNSFSPSAHLLSDAAEPRKSIHPSDTARPFNGWRQRKRLWRLAATEWLVTVLLCAFYGCILLYYNKQEVMKPQQIKTFNGFSTVVAFLLGVNLSASMRSYAKLLRWLVLSKVYRPLRTFDLVLNCDSLANVLRLTYRARNHGRPWYIPSKTQVCCVLWLLANITLTIFVGLMSLTYSLEDGTITVNTVRGYVYTTNFTKFGLGLTSDEYSRTQNWGARGFTGGSNYSVNLDYPDGEALTVMTLFNGTTAYWPLEFSVVNTRYTAFSKYLIRSDANCTEFPVTQGIYGNETGFTYDLGDGQMESITFLDARRPDHGGLWFSSSYADACGTRCTKVEAFLSREADSDSADDDPNTVAKYYQCQNVFRLVSWLGDESEYVAPERVIQDGTARMLAGAIGWPSDKIGYTQQPDSYPGGSNSTDDDTHEMFMIYDRYSAVGSEFSSAYQDWNYSSNAMADFVSSFTMQAIAAADSVQIGLPWMTVWGDQPQKTQYLSIDWPTAIALLGGMAGGQFLILVLVFIFANKVVIKDDSPLSMAKLYLSLLKTHRFEERGCMLEAEEMIKEMGNPMVKYASARTGFNEADGTEIRHIDVFQLDPARSEPLEHSFVRSKYYDGYGSSNGVNDDVVRKRE